MCGITGFWDTSGAGPADRLTSIVTAMADTLVHRGPDDGGAWSDAEAGLALGFRRLSIIDLSAAGHQPMLSASGRYAMSYNGEIYNAEDIRKQFGTSAPNWRGHSDTEVMLEAFAQWGVERTLPQLVGMFATALWDRKERRLTLIRDRLGKKPLYWSWQDGCLLFGSELRALRAHPRFRGTLDRGAIAAFLRHSYVPHPHTVYEEVRQLPPGSMLTLEPGKEPRISPYWTLAGVVQEAGADAFTGSDSEAVEALDATLGEAVRCRMVSDVPLGAFLSGGYDSSTVVALMQRHSTRPVRTFSIGFHEKGYDESGHARAVARHLGTDHTELIVTPGEALDVVPRLADLYDEPFADSSQIPTFLVSKLARAHVTVALSGDGGDELFAGYNRYAQADLFRRYAVHVPRPARSLGAAAVRSVSPAVWDRAFAPLPERYRPRLVGDKLYKLADVVAETGDGFYHKLTSLWHDPESVVIGAREPPTLITDGSVAGLVPDFVERMQYKDTLTYLPDDILTKVDRATMAVSLEARVPMLDQRVVSLAWRLPLSMRLRGQQSKWVLRQVLDRYVPRALVDRPKMGFGVPIDGWLRGPLRAWAEDLLSEASLRNGGVFEPAPVRTRWIEHLSGRRNWQHALWNVLMFEAWRRRWA